MSEFTKAYQAMITKHGWAGTAATLGMSLQMLEARVYGFNGNGMRVDTAMTIQRYAGTSDFAQAVAAASGGVFVRLPDGDVMCRDDLQNKFHELHKEIGDLSGTYMAATADGEIDKKERRQLEDIEQRMHKTMRELMALMFIIYCPSTAAGDA